MRLSRGVCGGEKEDEHILEGWASREAARPPRVLCATIWLALSHA